MTAAGLGPAWLPLGPGTLDGVPESRGVFVLGTIVRSPLLVGVAEDRGLRSAVAEAVRGGPVARQARCFRFEACDDPRARAEEILAAYRAAHEGRLPPAQGATRPDPTAPVPARRVEPATAPSPERPARSTRPVPTRAREEEEPGLFGADGLPGGLAPGLATG